MADGGRRLRGSGAGRRVTGGDLFGASWARQMAAAVALAARLARFKLPKTVLFVDALPRNSMGKVRKGVLRADCLAPKV